jgi:hypothetical protein
MTTKFSRRTALRGMFNGMAVAVGLPFLDMFLDRKGAALAATGAPLPTRFGCWYWGLGCTPARFFPGSVGPDYEVTPELEPIRALKQKVNVFGDFAVPLDGRPNFPHGSGGVGIRCGVAPTSAGMLGAASLDVMIGDVVGTKTRFRSLEIASVGGARNSLSGRGGGNVNPAESSPLALYTRLFGPGFKDPNSATFTPDSAVMARRSVLSYVEQERTTLEKQAGASDRQRLDQYFTSVRQLEKQLDVELTKPQPMEACRVPDKIGDSPADANIDNVVKNNQLMSDLLVMALACDQTRVFNMNFNDSTSSLTRLGSSITHHQLTHEEHVDLTLGYQPQATYFVEQILKGWGYFLGALDAVKEGDGTLLDHSLVFAHSETDWARLHTIDNIPMMTAGSGSGRIKTGLYLRGKGSPASRLGLTLQQAMGVSVDTWGANGLQTNKTITEILA